MTKLFPNVAEPMLAVYNRLQLVALSRSCDVDVRAVIPWFPGAGLFARWSSAGKCVAVPREEVVDGLLVRHPRTLFLPKVGARLAPELYAASLWPQLRHLRGSIDVVLGCWAFPDGVAATLLARRLGAASVVKVHGSDLNVLADREPYRTMMSRAFSSLGRLVAVSRPLADKAIALGIPRERVVLVRNGLDRELFQPRDRAAARAALGADPGGRLILFVGLVDRTKGLLELLEAFEALASRHADVRLAIVGDGPDAPLARAAAARRPGRIILTGALPLAQVAQWMSACDLLTLPSWNEGTPNVLLEALASGRRVVATRVGGIPDVVTSPRLGLLVPPRDPAALTQALERGIEEPYDPAELTAAAPHGWSESAAQLHGVLAAAAGVCPGNT